jgi:hypothetical protein
MMQGARYWSGLFLIATLAAIPMSACCKSS